MALKKPTILPGSLASASRDVIEAPDSSLIIVGLTTDNGSNRLTLVGTDAQGTMLWQKDYGAFDFQYLDNMLMTRNVIKGVNCFYYVSSANDDSAYLSVLIKFNYTGDTVWQKKFYSGIVNTNLYFNAVTETVDGGLLMTGIFEHFDGTGRGIALIKTDLQGNELWRKELVRTTIIYSGLQHWCLFHKRILRRTAHRYEKASYSTVSFTLITDRKLLF